MARSHQMTAKRRAALKKAQAASARKRRGKGRTGRRYTKPSKRRYAAQGVGSALLMGTVGGANPVSYAAASAGAAIGSVWGYRRDMARYKNSRRKSTRRKKR